MKKNESIISVDKLTLCYQAKDKLINKLSECDELTDSDDCFYLERIPCDDALFSDSFNVIIKRALFDGTGGLIKKKLATLRIKSHSMSENKINYVWLYIENWVFYETFTAIQGKHNWLACVDYIVDELGLSFNNVTSLDIALDTSINFAKRIKSAQFNDDYGIILNGTFRTDKKEVLNEIRYLQTGDQYRLRTLSIYITPKKQNGLGLKVYDKKRELEKSNKTYIPQWNELKNSDYRIELTLKNEHMKEFYEQKGEVIPDELLMATLASQQESQAPLFDMLLYFSNRLLRFRYNRKTISIFQL